MVFINKDNKLIGTRFRENHILQFKNYVHFWFSSAFALWHLKLSRNVHNLAAVIIQKYNCKIPILTILAKFGAQFCDKMHGRVAGWKIIGVNIIEYAHHIEFSFPRDVCIICDEK